MLMNSKSLQDNMQFTLMKNDTPGSDDDSNKKNETWI